MPEMHVNAVDLWKAQPLRSVEGAETYDTEPHEENLQRLVEINQQYLGGRINILRMSTLEASRLVADQTQDFVFIDADHTEEGCRADIEAWTPKIRPGGLICGHDYNWPTVKRAVLATGGNITRESDNVWLRFIP
jgi:predicted O-methyltransferase YrrM